MPLLGCAGTAAGFIWNWFAIDAGCCIVVSWYLSRVVVRRPNVISGDFLKLALRRTVFTSIGLVSRVFAYGPGDLGSIPGRVIPKTFKMVLDISLLNTQQYKIRIKGKVEQSREKSSALSYTLV